MPRPKSDGATPAAPNKRKLTEIFVRKLTPRSAAFVVWDEHQRGLAIAVQPMLSDSQSLRRGPPLPGSADPQAQRLTVAGTHNFVTPLWTLCGTLPPCVGWPAHN